MNTAKGSKVMVFYHVVPQFEFVHIWMFALVTSISSLLPQGVRYVLHINHSTIINMQWHHDWFYLSMPGCWCIKKNTMLQKCDLSAVTFLLLSFTRAKANCYSFCHLLFEVLFYFDSVPRAFLSFPLWVCWDDVVVVVVVFFKWMCSRKGLSVLLIPQRGLAAVWTGAISRSKPNHVKKPVNCTTCPAYLWPSGGDMTHVITKRAC